MFTGGDFGGPKPFHFERIWWEHSGLREVVDGSWDRRTRGSPTFTLAQKLIGLQTNLRHWNREVVGNIFSGFKQLEEEIARL